MLKVFLEFVNRCFSRAIAMVDIPKSEFELEWAARTA